jgi:hypothetical protein
MPQVRADVPIDVDRLVRTRSAGRWRDTGCASTKGSTMTERVYKVIQLVGTSTESWERAASAAVERASSSLRDLRVAEIAELDLVLEDGAVTHYRAKVNVSFKYEDDAS